MARYQLVCHSFLSCGLKGILPWLVVSKVGNHGEVQEILGLALFSQDKPWIGVGWGLGWGFVFPKLGHFRELQLFLGFRAPEILWK